MSTTLIAYVPVLHKGYFDLFLKYPDTLYLVGPAFVSEEFPRLIRDLRQLPVEEMVKAISGLGIFKYVEMLSDEVVQRVQEKSDDVIMPNEEISHRLAEQFFSKNSVVYENVFLRWDRQITLREQEVVPHRIVSMRDIDVRFMKEAEKEAQKSSDWWRQVGALAMKDGKIILAGHNRCTPTDYNLFACGNPRDNFDAGEHPEIYTSIHGEAGIVAKAAREGISLRGSEMYVTTFPCANCARLLAEAGVVCVYYREGYSTLDAEDIFKASGIEIVLVKER